VPLLRYLAMGLVIVFLRADFGGYDALADPVGWGLVIWSLWGLRGRLANTDVLLWVASLALVASLATYPPAVSDRLTASGQWGVSLPQIAFCLVLCGSLATWTRSSVAPGAEAGPATTRATGRARWLDLLRWVYVAVAVGPVVVFGGGVEQLTAAVAVLSVVANLALVYLTFAVSGPLRRAEPDGDRSAR
jgi:hypothetical protein